MNCKPEVELVETIFQALFEIDEEATVFGGIFRVDEDAIQLVSKLDAAVMPDTLDDLRFPGCGAEVAFNFSDGPSEERSGNGGAVVKPQGQQEFEATKSAHMWLVLRR